MYLQYVDRAYDQYPSWRYPPVFVCPTYRYNCDGSGPVTNLPTYCESYDPPYGIS
jgi:hypothetical protein